MAGYITGSRLWRIASSGVLERKVHHGNDKDIFQKVAELNTILDKYDSEVKFDWNEYSALVGRYFSAAH